MHVYWMRKLDAALKETVS